MTLLADLRHTLAKKPASVIFVVGTGVSVGALRGSPCQARATWAGLLADGLQRIYDLGGIDSKTLDAYQKQLELNVDLALLSVADLVTHNLAAPKGGEFRRWLRETVGCFHQSIRDRALLTAIAEHQRRGVLLATTNYDHLLEIATKLKPVTWRNAAAVERAIRGDEPRVLHLHGEWEEPESIVLGTRSYGDVVRDPHAQTVLATLRTAWTFVFVGCGAGLRDPNLGAFLKWTGDVFENSETRHFRLCLRSEVDALRTEHPPRQRVFPLSYGDDHADLAPFLRALLTDGTDVARSDAAPQVFVADPPPDPIVALPPPVPSLDVVTIQPSARPQSVIVAAPPVVTPSQRSVDVVSEPSGPLAQLAVTPKPITGYYSKSRRLAAAGVLLVTVIWGLYSTLGANLVSQPPAEAELQTETPKPAWKPVIQTAASDRVPAPAGEAMSGTSTGLTPPRFRGSDALPSPYTTEPTNLDILNDESFGELKLGLPESEVRRRFGEPTEKDRVAELWGATGEYHLSWTYADHGIVLDFSSDKEVGPWRLASILANAPCVFRTSRGIGINDPRSSVEAAYGRDIATDADSNESVFIAGSIYGGIVFSFDPKTRTVEQIYFGPGAE